MPDREPAGWPWLRERLTRLRPATRSGADSVPSAGSVRTAVVTDSAAALPVEWVRAFTVDGRLTVVPMPVMVGAEIYGEGEDDITETIAVAIACGRSVKTSRPSPGQFEQAYLAAKRRGFESVVSVHISGELSGTADAARLAAGRVAIPVQVLDSRTVGMAEGMGVQSAVVAAAEGRNAADVRAFAEERLALTKVYFYVPSLEQLRQGGRIGAAAALWGTMFSIKPILAVEDGKIVPLEKVRSAAKAVARLEEIVAADVAARPVGHARIAIHHFGNQPEAERLAARLAVALPDCPAAQISALPAALAAHAGLGVLAVIVGESSTPPALSGLLST
ncbi:DegV family protein with EDD domain [Arthrobacter sp. V4I6]|uniref:DegV family protein n=1 Tax=unclassified Arthrobacter TaxID=235627 RepID=UPI00278849AB|nr:MULTISPECIES: DegV family protein [unclassified Arthrobacter]MDQ0820935.1 DegV family protein with EDD domain [Arthrobacter sp. V1I7]MDQ0855196.1 DegV family protein with EDD domain [Arthrobacter sp. V4I6]